jgi:hypothetical protein
MRWVVRACLCLLALLVLVRAASFAVYTLELLSVRAEVGDLESKFVHLAWRVQAGVRLYPPWRVFPHVTNFFSPCYFLVVGHLGSSLRAGLAGLFLIGRSITVVSGLTTSLALAWLIRRSDGPAAAITGAASSLGAAPMIGAGLMARPDTLAECLGTVGFFLAIGASNRSRGAGLILLSLAILTKQTALIFLLAATAVLALTHGPRRAGMFLASGLAAIALVIGVATAWFEPLFATSLLGESYTPWDIAYWADQLRELAVKAPDLLIVPAIALPIWLSDRPRRSFAVILWLAVLGSGLVTAAKLGSGLNYFLSLRVIEAIAIGTIWRAASRAQTERPLQSAAAALVTALSLVPGTLVMAQAARSASAQAQFLGNQEGQRFLLAQQEVFSLAEDTKVSLLTDSGVLQLHQGERAPFVDPFQFRILFETGAILPNVMLEQVRTESYDLVITTSDLESRRYETNIFGLPSVLMHAVRDHYRLSGRRLGLYLYVRRGAPH